MKAKKPEPNIWSVIAVYVFFLAAVGRTFAWIDDKQRLLGFLGLELAFLILMSWMIWRPGNVRWLQHACLIAQVAIITGLELLAPEEDFINVLFVLVSFQIGHMLQGTDFWIWAGSILFVTCGSLIITSGFLEGVAKSLLNMAGEVTVMAFFLVSRDVNIAREKRETMLQQLQEANARLKQHADEVEEMATLNERIRLARELHDSVSQTLFSITLNTRSAQLLLKKNPKKLDSQLTELQHLSEAALAEIRGMITQLRPK